MQEPRERGLPMFIGTFPLKIPTPTNQSLDSSQFLSVNSQCLLSEVLYNSEGR